MLAPITTACPPIGSSLLLGQLLRPPVSCAVSASRRACLARGPRASVRSPISGRKFAPHREVAERVGGGLAATTELELGEHARDVMFDGLAADEQALGHVGVGESLAQEPQHLELALRERPAGPLRASANRLHSERAQEAGCSVGIARSTELLKGTPAHPAPRRSRFPLLAFRRARGRATAGFCATSGGISRRPNAASARSRWAVAAPSSPAPTRARPSARSPRATIRRSPRSSRAPRAARRAAAASSTHLARSRPRRELEQAAPPETPSAPADGDGGSGSHGASPRASWTAPTA